MVESMELERINGMMAHNTLVIGMRIRYQDLVFILGWMEERAIRN